MIFSKLFKDKWQSKNVDTRLQAINELDSRNLAEQEVLLELIDNDPNKKVRLKALESINQFTNWLIASNNNSNSDVRIIAQEKIENIVLGLDTITLSKAEKFAFLEQQPRQQFLEKWLFKEINTNLKITLYELLNKPQLAIKLFSETHDIKLQTYIIEQNDDVALLEKLAKKTKLKEHRTKINQKIAQIKSDEDKPIKLAKNIQLVLAKFLALKEIVTYKEMLTRKEKIEKQWTLYQADFELLSQEEQRSFNEKWQAIEAQLSKIFSVKAKGYQQQQIEVQLESDKKVQLTAFNEKLQEFSQHLSTAIYENTPVDQAVFNNNIDLQLKALTNSLLDDDNKQQLSRLFEQVRNKLLQSDAIAESITKATHLISQLSQVALPNTVEQYTDKIPFYRDWQKQWKLVNNAAFNMLPESIIASYKQLTTQWNAAIKIIDKEQQIQLNKVKNKLADVKRLINSGKFNASFGVFKTAEKSYLLLTEQQQQNLTKEYTWCQDKINELSDWESYISTPKKQSLLLEIQALAEQPLPNRTEQADKVKNYRKLWNALGHAQADLEEELNNAFNLACERAFAPCRLFYSEQEKLRAKHLHNREQLINESEVLKNCIEHTPIDWKKLDSDLNKLLQKWRNAGEIDKQLYHRLNEKFNHALAPVKNAIFTFHQENADKKKTLVNKAEKLSLQDNADQASDEIKTLQNQWRDIGYSGSKLESKLWKAFRGFNDDVFEKRKQLHQAVLENNNIKLVELSDKVTKLIEKASTCATIAQINEYVDESNEFKEQLFSLKPYSNNLLTQLASLAKQLKSQKSLLLAQKSNQSWLTLFNVLQKTIEQEITFEANNDFNELENKWKKRLQSITSAKADQNSRKEKTIALELIAGVKPTKVEQAETMRIQVELMQQQLSNKQEVTLEGGLCDWLALGCLSKSDLPLLARIQPLFVSTK